MWSPGHLTDAAYFETAREIVAAERKLGIDAHIIDCGNNEEVGEIAKTKIELAPFFQKLGIVAEPAMDAAIEWLKSKKHFAIKPVEPGTEDRGVKVESVEWAKNADILIGHSGFTKELRELDKPLIMCAHGRPRSSFLLELHKEYPVYSGYVQMGQNKKILKYITFWEEHIPNIEILVGEGRVEYVPPLVDLERFNPKGETTKFNNPGEFNIVITDIWRKDIDPYDVVHCCHLFCKKHPGARFHMFGCKPTDQLGPWHVLLGRIKMQGTLGTHVALIKDIDKVYRTADMMVTPHRIATRTVREALASGLPLIAGEGNRYTPFHAPVWDYPRFVAEMERCYKSIQLNKEKVSIRMRESAKKHFDPMNTAREMKRIIEETIELWKNKPKEIEEEPKTVEAVVR